jgi:hypothetical protein
LKQQQNGSHPRDQYAVPFDDIRAGVRGIRGRILGAQMADNGVEILRRLFDADAGAKTSYHSEKSEIARGASRVSGDWKRRDKIRFPYGIDKGSRQNADDSIGIAVQHD